MNKMFFHRLASYGFSHDEKKQLHDHPLKTELFWVNIWHEDNYKYYCFLFPYASSTLKEIIHSVTDGGKVTTQNIYKIETLIMRTIKQYLKGKYYKRRDCFYIFFDTYLIFCQKSKKEWYTNIVTNNKNLDELNRQLKPVLKIRQLTDDDLKFINITTKHLHTYNISNDYNLLYSIIQVAVDDALSMQRPRSFEQASRKSKNNKIKDRRPVREQNAYEARMFLLEESDYLNRILDLLDLDHEFFYSSVERKIRELDNRRLNEKDKN